MNAELLCGLLAEPSRLRTYSAVVLGARGPEEIAAATGLSAPVIVKAVQRLCKNGLISASGDGLHAEEDAFKNAVRENQREWVPLDADPERDAVLRAFIRDGRLTHLPTVFAKTQIVLEYLVQSFETGRTYSEPEVNALLNTFYPDHATLRRLLVDAHLLNRSESRYTRNT